jgi:hypothetical protein
MLGRLVQASTSRGRGISLPAVRSSHYFERREKVDRIAQDNERLVSRLAAKGPSLNVAQQLKDYRQARSHSHRLRKYMQVGNQIVSKQELAGLKFMRHRLGFNR